MVSLGLPPFVATLGTLGIAQGLALVATGGQSVVGIGDALPALYESRVLGIPFSIVIALGGVCRVPVRAAAHPVGRLRVGDWRQP